jgi:hypothetical protein
VEDVKCNGTTKEKHEEETQNLRRGQDTPNVEVEE